MAQTNADREPPALAIHAYPVWDRTVRGFHLLDSRPVDLDDPRHR